MRKNVICIIILVLIFCFTNAYGTTKKIPPGQNLLQKCFPGWQKILLFDWSSNGWMSFIFIRRFSIYIGKDGKFEATPSLEKGTKKPMILSQKNIACLAKGQDSIFFDCVLSSKQACRCFLVRSSWSFAKQVF